MSNVNTLVLLSTIVVTHGGLHEAPRSHSSEGVTSREAPGEQPRPIAASRHEDIEVEVFALGEDSVGISVGGPSSSRAFAHVVATMNGSASPAHFLRALDPDAHVPESLELLSRRVVDAGNWHPGVSITSSTNRPEPRSGDLVGGLWARSGGNFADNYGTGKLYARDAAARTTWTLDDNVAAAAYVAPKSGAVIWKIRKRNCNTGCKYFDVYAKLIASGYHYFFIHVNMKNDFRMQSVVQSLSDGGTHYHRAARCHDYHARTSGFWSTLAGGCAIYWDYQSMHCNSQYYVGVDPSPIFTTHKWIGDGMSHYNCR